jgi:hypothetical protein
MLSVCRARRRQLLPAIISFAALVVLSSHARDAQAGILLPEQIDFTADDLEQSMSARATEGAGSSSSRHRDSQPLSPMNDSEHQEQLGLEHANLPSGTSSGGSSSSSSPAGGSMSAGAIGWSATTIAIQDDSPIGRLAEDYGLSLPDPPGTDLLRPPRI